MLILMRKYDWDQLLMIHEKIFALIVNSHLKKHHFILISSPPIHQVFSLPRKAVGITVNYSIIFISWEYNFHFSCYIPHTGMNQPHNPNRLAQYILH